MKKEKKVKTKKNINKILLKVLLILIIVEVIFIPLYYYAEVKKFLGIMLFVLIPLILGTLVVLLSRNCYFSYENKKAKIEEKLK